MWAKEELEEVVSGQYDQNVWFIGMKFSKNKFKLCFIEEKVFFGI